MNATAKSKRRTETSASSADSTSASQWACPTMVTLRATALTNHFFFHLLSTAYHLLTMEAALGTRRDIEQLLVNLRVSTKRHTLTTILSSLDSLINLVYMYMCLDVVRELENPQ